MLATNSIDTTIDQMNTGLLLLRLCLGLFLAYHGVNKIFGTNGLSGTAAWFSNIGFKWPSAQARIAALTEIGAGLLFAIGLLTSVASAGIIGIMIVAIVVAHWKVGFFVFHPGQGWEYCATIAVGALAVGMIGPGDFSVDNIIDFMPSGWTPLALALGIGVGSALAQLLICYRPSNPKSV
jgi:putative oxidoreductase